MCDRSIIFNLKKSSISDRLFAFLSVSNSRTLNVDEKLELQALMCDNKSDDDS